MSSASPSRSPVAASRQLLVVVAPHWESTAGRLQRFAREHVDAGWRAVGQALPVSLGRSGLAWGRGRHPPPGGAGPVKREGDGRSPAGVFAISALFGTAALDSPLARAARLPYLVATAGLKAIDDPESAHYNRIVDQAGVAHPDWTSCEDMLRDDGRYAVGAVVAHNAEPPLPGAGSCIFLHVRESAGAPTAGCTTLALDDMREIAGWLDGATAPQLVQLPRAEYERLRADWGLPLCAP